MELDALALLLDIARLGNFSRAARERNVAVSSVTRRIELLEQDLGTALFNRNSRSVQLTDAGLRLLATARQVVAEVADARDAITAMQAEPRGGLVVTAPVTFGRRRVAAAVASFLLKYPLLEVELRMSDDVVDLQAQRVDVALRIGVLPDSDLLATSLAQQRRVAVASPRYLARAGRPQAPQDLLQHNCLTHAGPGHRVGWWTFHGVNEGKPLRVAGSLRSGDSDSLMQAALAGVGVAHLATWLVGDEVAAGRLVLLFDSELRDPPVSGSGIHAVRVAGRSVRKSKLFVEHLKREFGVADGEPPLWERQFAAALRR